MSKDKKQKIILYINGVKIEYLKGLIQDIGPFLSHI